MNDANLNPNIQLAPIVLFVYNRVWHTKQTIEALQKNIQALDSHLFIFSDNAKDETSKQKVDEVRGLIHAVSGFKSVTVIERGANFGLAKSIIDGVTQVIDRYGKVIVMEDDLVTSPYFLTFMNDALRMYANDEKVMHISGYIFPIEKVSLPETFFYNSASCWGWATWKRAWDQFNPDAQALLQKIKNDSRIKEFNMDGCNPDFEKQLENNISKRKITWAIKWHASVFLCKGLCLHPRDSLVANIGHDGSGENCNLSNIYETQISKQPIKLERIELVESILARRLMCRFYLKKRPSLIKRLLAKIKTIIK